MLSRSIHPIEEFQLILTRVSLLETVGNKWRMVASMGLPYMDITLTLNSTPHDRFHFFGGQKIKTHQIDLGNTPLMQPPYLTSIIVFLCPYITMKKCSCKLKESKNCMIFVAQLVYYSRYWHRVFAGHLCDI